MLTAGLVLATVGVTAPGTARAEPSLRSITIPVNKSQTVDLPTPATDLLVGSTQIADVIPLSDDSVYVLGKAVGTTNITVLDQDRRVTAVIDVQVTLDTEALQGQLREITGNNRLRVRAQGDRLILSGSVHDAVAVERAVTVANGLAPGGVVNALEVTSPQQVMLQVQFLEASRQATRQFGVSWDSPDFFSGEPGGGFAQFVASIAQSGTGSITATIDALEREGVVRRLAEPNLITASGQPAEFLAGGEFPVPVATPTERGATVTIEFKPFGVELSFVPTVLEDGLINLQIEPSVSSIDFSSGVTVLGTTVPGVSTRRASTNVELRDGQSFAIAGLLDATAGTNADQLPWLGSVPVIGALFRSSSFQKQETELVVIVTPRLVRPAAPGQSLRSPLDATTQANDADYFIAGRSEIQKQITTIMGQVPAGTALYGHVLPSPIPAAKERADAH